MTIATFLIIAALILAILAGCNTPSGRFNLFAFSFACFIAWIMVTKGAIG